MAEFSRKRLWQNTGLAWVVALAIMAAVFMYWRITPFGNHSLLMSDMGTQYIPLLTALRHALRYQVFHFYTFSQSLGSGLVPTVAYYLLSPFNLIVLFFGTAQVPMAASVIIMVKIATIAATMTWYLQRHFRTTQRMTMVFALAFSFCGFVAVNYFDLMWLDSLILLPLVAAGVDRLVDQGRPVLFFGSLLASILTNYYLGYMTCLFSLLYFAYVLTNWQGSKVGSRPWYGRIGRFALTGALSGLSAAIILIPTGLGMLLTAKSATKLLNFHLTPEFGAEFFTQFGVGATNYSQRLMHAPTVFVTSAVVLLTVVYFCHAQFSRRQKWSAATLLLALFLGMWVRLFNTIWHLMQAPAGFPFRNVFFLSFVMVMLGFAAWQAEPRQIKRSWQWELPLIQAALVVGGAASVKIMLRLVSGRSAKLTSYFTGIQQVHWESVGISVVYIFVTAAVIFGTRAAWRKWLLSGLVITEVAGNFILAMGTSKFGNQQVYAQAYRQENQQMAKVNDPDGQLYRVQNDNALINRAFQGNYNNYNDSLTFNFHGISGYSSTLSESTRTTLEKLGMFSDNVRRIGDVGLTPLTELLLGVKDTVHLGNNSSWQTRTTGYSGMGFAVSTALQNVQLTSDALQNQEQIMQALRPQRHAYLQQAAQLADHVKVVSQVKGVKTTYKYHHQLSLKMKATGPAYLWVPSGQTKYATMKVNGVSVAPATNANDKTALVKLGNFKRGQTISVTFAAKYSQAIYHTQVASLRQADFARLLQTVRRQRLTVKTVSSPVKTSLQGHVTGTPSRSDLYLSIPYDAGWQATVNGNRVQTTRVLDGLTRVPLQNGKNTVTLTYHVPGGRLGAGISLVSLLSFAGLAWWWRIDEAGVHRERSRHLRKSSK
ncbi:YfhO family protein [Levilactobacillus sp. N40-8-2]|uniref:YfhO family protein n=1 Tax=Levilactobacillus muriae TaxID=3238987 RepID=UPI0038B397EB